ncbi:solute carrier family 41 member 1-like, partial [Uloborus diversus]|uniref:solute carrier family 41 member 1-like n=1 Tax=Uloborus diversus TaxID=327109 RepID=UPI002409625B
MAVLLDIRRLEPMMNHNESSANLTTLTHEPVSFGNPTFQDDLQPDDTWSPTTPAVTVNMLDSATNNNDSRLDDQNKPKKAGLSSSDSGILICVPVSSSNDDNSSLGEKSLDSGVFENGGGGGDGWSPGDAPRKEKAGASPEEQESLLAICIQVFIPFLIAGAGTCGAGIVLDHVEDWSVFQNVTELFILVPTLLGLKGNLEMTLASRVSTQANLGKLESAKEKWQMAWGNMALIQ